MAPRTSLTDPLEIASVPSPRGGGVIGLTFCPGKKQSDAASGAWARDLEMDLAAIETWGATHLVTLIEDHELRSLGVSDLPERAARRFQWLHLAISDQGVPDEAWEQLWREAGSRLRDALMGRGKVVIHCKGGLGRTGTIAAKLLIELGMDPSRALKAVRGAREGAVENVEQENYVLRQRPLERPPARPYHRLNPEAASRYRGCLLGGAVGDALGGPIEFLKLPEIQAQFGKSGIRDQAEAYGRVGAITDDTQMTLFTAEGLLRGQLRSTIKGIGHPATSVAHAYQRWLRTQGRFDGPQQAANDGWLYQHKELHSPRAPGATCLSALAARQDFASNEPAVNQSKGCGGVMRAAPVGLLTASLKMTTEASFKLGVEIAQITHGHPTGSLTAGVLAALIHELIGGLSLLQALGPVLRHLATYGQHGETLQAVEQARELANSRIDATSAISKMGEGWVAEEALAIAVYCALKAPNLEEGVILAVNHSGDSDSTGAIAGNLLGAELGFHEIPRRWLDQLELREVITEIADDLATVAQWRLTSTSGNLTEVEAEEAYWLQRYPAW